MIFPKCGKEGFVLDRLVVRSDPYEGGTHTSAFLFNDFDSLERYFPVVISRSCIAPSRGGCLVYTARYMIYGEDSGHSR